MAATKKRTPRPAARIPKPTGKIGPERRQLLSRLSREGTAAVAEKHALHAELVAMHAAASEEEQRDLAIEIAQLRRGNLGPARTRSTAARAAREGRERNV